MGAGCGGPEAEARLRPWYSPSVSVSQGQGIVYDRPLMLPAGQDVLLLAGPSQVQPPTAVESALGAAGADVTGIEVRLTDGTRITATVQSGLWVLPLLVLSARPWWEHLVWAGVETLHFVATWLHIALARKGNTMRMFYGGKLVATESFSGSIPDIPGPLTIGNSECGGFFNGTIDQVRFSSKARYTANFIPPPTFAKDGDTIGLWTLDEILQDSSTAVS